MGLCCDVAADFVVTWQGARIQLSMYTVINSVRHVTDGLVGKCSYQNCVVLGSNPGRSKSGSCFYDLGLCVLMYFFA